MLLIGRNPKRTLVRIAVLVVTCFVVFRFILLPIHIEGISMLPAYHTGQVNCVNRLAYLGHEPRRGDIVCVRLSAPNWLSTPGVMYMKRVIGLPGEAVSFRDGRAYINDRPLDEHYVKEPCNWQHDPVQCSPTQYYLVGDNRSMPFELHSQGRAERDRIIGKLLL